MAGGSSAKSLLGFECDGYKRKKFFEKQTDFKIYGLYPKSGFRKRRRIKNQRIRQRIPRCVETNHKFNCLANCSGFAGCCTKYRSEEHTSELQSRENLVCRLL